jgi:transposase
LRQGRVAALLVATGLAFERVSPEAGPLAPWLCDGLATAGLPMICIYARHMKAAVSAMPVKTDRSDVRNLAFAMQVGWYRAVHLKRPETRKLRMLPSSREMLLRMPIDLDDHIRGVLKAARVQGAPANPISAVPDGRFCRTRRMASYTGPRRFLSMPTHSLSIGLGRNHER